ncbi:HlyD family type I secretion periplasmic adaptor subunit [Mesorhizobium sp. CAU 1741]|uniref:HlyD family type I secretion periplasmic adaptor subunit n=1 Tax=Mesorhizobium sp. CAU 1741 TaxID=3140366 RepID=UPI00325A8653
MTEKTKDKSFSPTPYVIAGYTTIVLAFGVFGTWASTAPLASGVVAGGTVAVYSNRKVVQHLEGGIVSEILVQEGNTVDAGDILVRLDAKQAQGNHAVLSTRLAFLKATEARLEAESMGEDEIQFPPEVLGAISPGVPEPLFIKLQRNIFEDRNTTRDGQISILKVRAEQLQEEIVGLEAQRQAFERQVSSIGEEIVRVTRGQEGGYVATNQVAQLSRTSMEMEGNLGQVISSIAKAKQSIAETELQILQIDQEFAERASSELRDIRDQVQEVSERVKQAKDILDRTVIRAPVHGMVQNIQIHTTSGVIRPAEQIMDIIPLDDDLIINARVRPVDIDNVDIGNMAEIRFPAFSSRTTPVIFGSVQVLSQDIIQPEDTRVEPYYVARVEVAEADIPSQIRGRLVPGMPAEVIFVAGERTLVQYLVKPLQDAFSKGLLEQ